MIKIGDWNKKKILQVEEMNKEEKQLEIFSENSSNG